MTSSVQLRTLTLGIPRLSLIIILLCATLGWQSFAASADLTPVRQMERLGRGVVAINCGDHVFVSWRLLGTEPQDTAFNVYRQAGESICTGCAKAFAMRSGCSDWTERC